MNARRRSPLLVLGLAALAACGSGGDRSRAGPSAVLVTLDTTRADALGCYGNPRARTPRLDALAAGGVRFANATTVAPLTLPAHVAMLTGLYPPRSRVRSNGPHPLPEAAETLAETARRAGVRTAAFVSAAVLDARFGLAQGFERYDAPAPREGGGPEVERAAALTVAAAVRWLEANADGRFFLWVHLFDPHAPYAPPPDLRTGLLAQEPYLAEVAAADRAVGELIGALERLGVLERTTIVAVGDHGEGLGQHGEATHGSFCYQPTLRVPLIVNGPGVARGIVDERLASVVDVFPTLASALALPGVDPGDGRDLLAPAAADRGLYFESFNGYLSFGWSPLAGWIDARGKYLHSSEPELYDWRADPGETRNLFAASTDVAAYRAAIERVIAAPALPAERAAGADAELMAQVSALGYTGATRETGDLPDPLAPTDRPSPRRMADEDRQMQEAFQRVAAGDCARALPVLEAIVSANPHNLFALDMQAHCLARSGDRAGAIAILERVVAEQPLQPDFHHRLGKLYLEAGRPEDAAATFTAGLAIDPHHEPCRRGLEDAGRAPR